MLLIRHLEKLRTYLGALDALVSFPLFKYARNNYKRLAFCNASLSVKTSCNCNRVKIAVVSSLKLHVLNLRIKDIKNNPSIAIYDNAQEGIK